MKRAELMSLCGIRSPQCDRLYSAYTGNGRDSPLVPIWHLGATDGTIISDCHNRDCDAIASFPTSVYLAYRQQKLC